MPRVQSHLKRKVEAARKPRLVKSPQKGPGQEKDPMRDIGLSPRDEELQSVASRVASNENLQMLDDDLEDGLLHDNHIKMDTQVKIAAAADDDNEDDDFYKS